MMEYFLFNIIGFIITTQAFLFGVKMGRKLDTKEPIKTIVDVVKDIGKEKTNDIKEEVDEIMDFSYEKALQSVKEDRLRGNR